MLGISAVYNDVNAGVYGSGSEGLCEIATACPTYPRKHTCIYINMYVYTYIYQSIMYSELVTICDMPQEKWGF